jgi:hypothetical protein
MSDSNFLPLLLSSLPNVVSIVVDLAVAGIAFYGAQRLKSTGWMLVGISAVLAVMLTLPWLAWNGYLISQHPEVSQMHRWVSIISGVTMVGRLIGAGLLIAGLLLVIRDQLRRGAS